MSNILLLEDDLSLINGLSFAFKKQGFELVVARTLKEADSLWVDGKYDLLVLDVSLPDGTGFEFCKKVRQVSKVPIIFLTAADEEMDIIMGLDIGGDDYITKPFKLGVLVSRVNALLRRAKDFSSADTQLESNGMKVLLLQGQAFKNGKLFLLLLFLFGMVYLVLLFYLRRQHRAIDDAGSKIREFLDGNSMSRIECSQTGDWYSLFHDVNEMATILSAHAESQKQTKEFLQDIISDVSHQIKTPLSALKMYYEIISSHKGEAETVANFSEKSQREIKRMENVIYTLLKLARLDAGIIQMEKAEENVSALMQDVLERFETWAEQDHKEITLSGKDDISLNCDALWMSEAIGNIVKNALEHTQPGGHISVQWTQSPLLTQIVITDDGKGIHQEDLYNIFKRFYRSRFSSDVHGIGLGLPLAKSIVEAHGGTISVTSTLDVGTTFTLNFFSLTNE